MSIAGARITRALVCVAAVWALAGIALLRLVSPPGPIDSAGPTAPALGVQPLQSLPVAAQPGISTTLGASDGRFDARRVGTAWELQGGGVRARLGAGGQRFRVAADTLSLALVGPAVTSVTAHGNRVTLQRPGVREWYAAGPLGIEQGFTLAHRLAGATDHELTLSLAVRGALRPRAGSGSTVEFQRSGHGVGARYGALTAVDADGHRLPSRLAARGGRVLITVNDSGARYPITIDPLVQQGTRLTGGGESGPGFFGVSAALSADGNTALVGGESDDGDNGAAWVFTRSGGTWSQQGAKLTGGAAGAEFGSSVALSADGNTALIGANFDGASGGALVFTRSGSTWTRQGGELTGVGATGGAGFGSSVALSADGSTALVGAPSNGANNAGAAWAFTRNGSTWSPLGSALVATGESASGQFGFSVALSADGVTALVGGNNDAAGKGAAWAFVRNGGSFTQQAKLAANDETGAGAFGQSVALSADGNTALIGGPNDGINAQLGEGAAWVFTRSLSIWTQPGHKLTGSDAGMSSGVGSAVAVSSDATVALIGGQGDGGGTGAAWMFAHSGSTWTQQGAKLTGQGEKLVGTFGHSVALAADGQTALVGGNNDNNGVGAAWTFAPPAPTCSAVGATVPAGGGAVSVVLPCSGPAGAGLSYSIVAAPAHGSLGPVGADGRVTYTSRPGFVGADTFSYRVTDTWGVSNTGNATIGVPPFAAPVCTNVSAHGRKGATRVSVALSCHGPAGVPIAYAIVTAPGDGKLGHVSQANGRVTYTSPVGFSGTDRFIYRATDVGGASATATATIVLPKLDRITSTMTWGEFRAGPTSTVVPGMLVKSLPAGARVKLSCTRGCPIKARTVVSATHGVCRGTAKKRHCRLVRANSANLDLTRFVAHKRLRAGSQIIVAMIKSGSLGKKYVFRIVKSNQPSVKIQTLAPGSTAPCPGC
ncbi:MAG: Ig-like domain-containing protein [Solirubrobacteraceae bacterium]